MTRQALAEAILTCQCGTYGCQACRDAAVWLRMDISPEEIEARYEAALAEIRHRRNTREPEPWR